MPAEGVIVPFMFHSIHALSVPLYAGCTEKLLITGILLALHNSVINSILVLDIPLYYINGVALNYRPLFCNIVKIYHIVLTEVATNM